MARWTLWLYYQLNNKNNKKLKASNSKKNKWSLTRELTLFNIPISIYLVQEWFQIETILRYRGEVKKQNSPYTDRVSQKEAAGIPNTYIGQVKWTL